MYEVTSVLIYDGEPVALRLQDIRGRLKDVPINLIGNPSNMKLKNTRVESLIEHNGMILTMHEKMSGVSIQDISEDLQELEFVTKLLTTKVPIDVLEKVAKTAFKAVLNFNNAWIKDKYADGVTEYYSPNEEESYRIGAIINTRAEFSWNNNHDYCERHYDAYGVIDNCPKFDKWVEFTKELAERASRKYGVYVDIDLTGVKYELRLHIEVSSGCILK